MGKGFTLLELIVVIVILGILATLGFSQYNTMVESTRIAEAKVMIGSMRQLATEYYWKNGSFTGIGNSDLGVDNTFTSDKYFKYASYVCDSAHIELWATRCISGGKVPNGTEAYQFGYQFRMNSGRSFWTCRYGSSSFGYESSDCSTP